MRSLLSALLVLVAGSSATPCLATSAGATPAPTVEAGVSLSLAEERARLLRNVRYDLFFSIPEDSAALLTGRATIYFDWSGGALPLQIDFTPGADQVLSLRRAGRDLAWRYAQEHIVVDGAQLEAGANTLEIAFRAPQGSVNRNPDYLFTLFVPDRARTAFPLFDQPDIKARYTLTLETPGDWISLANGSLATTELRGDRRTSRFAATRPLASYQFAFASGRFEAVTQRVGEREMTFLHRETDADKLARNIDAIFALHGNALRWLEEYTGIAYPFDKFDFVLIPDFPYGGMEHVGAIAYRASSLLLEEDPSPAQRLRRAQLIAHETAHMWFGNLVTMRWFNDVWTKEVFANFMADKIVNPEFPDIDHELSFLTSHYPQALGVDRSTGANPIRQPLDNLNLAGQMYGPIIYHKAPIMMRQLESLIGETAFRDGLREYLARFAYANATWPELIDILDRRAALDLAAWSEVWVSTPGRPEFALESRRTADGSDARMVIELDPAERQRSWPQTFSVADLGATPIREFALSAPFPQTLTGTLDSATESLLLFNAGGRGYGLFPAGLQPFARWADLSPLQRGVLLINAYENTLEGRLKAADYVMRLSDVMAEEDNDLLLKLAGSQLLRVYFGLLSDAQRDAASDTLEALLWKRMQTQASPAMSKVFYEQLLGLAMTRGTLERLLAIWNDEERIDGLTLAEAEKITLAEVLAVRMPDRAAGLIDAQRRSIENPDRRRRFDFIAPALAPDPATRDAFFASLADPERRATEAWVADAVARLHDPTRRDQSRAYLRASLELLEEIQVTGDIFFPSAWLNASLRNHVAPEAAQIVREFLDARPDYNPQLRMKILQAADPLLRAQALRR